MSNLLLLNQQKFLSEWADKFSALAEMANTTRNALGSMATALAQNFGAIQANLEINSDAIEQIDIYNQIWAKMLLSVLEKVIAIQHPDTDSREKAKDDFQSIFEFCKRAVIEERTTRLKELQKKAQAEQAQNEKHVAEDALRNAEQALSTVGGEGSPIPEGAEIFGG